MKKNLFGMALAISLMFVCGAAFAQYTDIDDIQVYTSAGDPDETAPLWGTAVTVRGIVTCPPGIYNGGTTYVQDATGGVSFYLTGSGLALGDEIEVSGTVGSYSGEIQLNSASFNYIDAATVPDPVAKTPAELLGDYENVGWLVSVIGTVADDMTSSSFNIFSGTDSVLVYIDSTTLIDISAVTPGDEYKVISPCVNYNTIIELKPRYQGDLVEDPQGDTLPVISDVNCTNWVIGVSDDLVVTADVVDNIAVASVRLYYRDSTGDDDTGSFSWVTMTVPDLIGAPDTYEGTISGDHTGFQVDFYIEATDSGTQTVTNPGDAPTGFYSTAVGLTKIYDMQYVHPDSSDQNNNFNGMCISISGVVTAGTGEAGANSKFIMQEVDPIPSEWFSGKLTGVYPTEFVGASFAPDHSDSTCYLWSGTLIYESSAANTLFQGDIVEVAGRGNEYYSLSQVIPHNGSAIKLLSYGNDLPGAMHARTGWLADKTLEDGNGRLGEPFESCWVKTYDGVVTGISAYGDYTISDTGALADTLEVDPMITLSYVPVIGDRIIVEGFMDYDYGDFQVSPTMNVHIVANVAPVDNLPGPSYSVGYLENVEPNPFNPMTQIKFNVKVDNMVQLNVYGIRGNLVRQLVAGQLPADSYSFAWDGKNDAGSQMASGTYFARLRIGTKYVGVEKMTLVK